MRVVRSDTLLENANPYHIDVSAFMALANWMLRHRNAPGESVGWRAKTEDLEVVKLSRSEKVAQSWTEMLMLKVSAPAGFSTENFNL